MKFRSVVSLLLLLAACSADAPESARSGADRAEADSAVVFLLTSAAADFGSQATPPAEVRNVRAGHLEEPGTTPRYILCGEFARQAENGSSAWSPFVTIKTSDYEQWLGQQATTFCENSHVTWLRYGLTTDLQARLDSLT